MGPTHYGSRYSVWDQHTMAVGTEEILLSAGPRFDSGRKHVNSDSHGFEQIDPQAKVLSYCFQ